MNINNLRDLDVTALEEKITELREKNPLIRSEVYSMKNVNTELIDKIDSLERKIDSIFDGHILLDGKFIKIKT